MNQSLLFDLSDRCKLRVTGGDRLRFLNGQLTNDVRKASADESIVAAVLSAKGKLNALVHLWNGGDFFALDADAALTERLAARLERYVIADDVEIAEVTPRYALFHVTSERLPAVPNECKTVRANRFACAGTDIWCAAELHGRILQELSAAHILVNAADAETLRIERGIPRWERELTDEIIPNEAGLEPAAIDYHKGCYIGQEVISRIKTSGQTNKRLVGLLARDDGALRAGLHLATAPPDAKEVGWITSATHSERIGKTIALGYVKRGWNTPGVELFAGTSGVAVTVCELPFR